MYSKIVDGIVVNVIEASEEFIETLDGVWVQGGAMGQLYIDGEFISPPKPVEHFDLATYQAQSKAKIVATVSKIGATIEAKYSTVERSTWASQESDWRAYLLDVNASTPTLDNLANARFPTLEERRDLQAQRIGEALAIRDTLVGMQQKFEDLVSNATTKEEIDAILVSFDDAITTL